VGKSAHRRCSLTRARPGLSHERSSLPSAIRALTPAARPGVARSKRRACRSRREQQACHGEPSAPTRHRLHQHRQILLTFETSRARRRHSRARKGHSRAQMNLSRAREVHSRARMNLSAGNESLSAGNRSLSAGNERSKASNETLSARVGRPRREHVNLIEKLAAACRRNHVPGLRCPGRTRQGTLRPGGSRVGGHGVSSPPCPRQESPLRCKLPA